MPLRKQAWGQGVESEPVGVTILSPEQQISSNAARMGCPERDIVHILARRCDDASALLVRSSCLLHTFQERASCLLMQIEPKAQLRTHPARTAL
jgi:hypothetical protein